MSGPAGGAVTFAAAGPPAAGADWVERNEVVRPAMCGHNAQLVGHIGDWTWDAVSSLCGIDVLAARDASGAPTYLSFHYLRIRGSRRFHLRTPTFGDRLRIASRLFGFGSESVLTLHHIVRSPAGAVGPDGTAPGPIDPDTFYGSAGGESLRVESFNRWITRSDERSNHDLVRSSPTGFRHAHLPTLPERYSPRHPCAQARAELTFLNRDRHRPTGETAELTYRVDVSRDLNGVGLVYFASYFSIVDRGLLELWRRLGRSEAAFLHRVVVDQQLCYLGNADPGDRVAVTAARWEALGDPRTEAVNVVLRDHATGRPLAVSTLRLEREEQP